MSARGAATRRPFFMDLFHNAPICRTTGMRFEYDQDGRAVFHFPRNQHFDHALQDVHGGVIAMLLDNAGWFTVAPHYGRWLVTAEFSVRLLEPARQDPLRAVGYPVRIGKRMAVADMRVFGTKDRVVATGSGTFVVTPTALP